MTTPPERATVEAELIIRDAADRFGDVVTDNDFVMFQRTSLEDVLASTRQLEETLALQQKNPNTGRLIHWFRTLERYSKAATFSLESTTLALLWAPVKLTLELVTNHSVALNHLISAYKRIALKFPTFEDLPKDFCHSVVYQYVWAIFYEAILDFHRAVYLILKRPGWESFFDFWWDKYKPRFELLLSDLSKNSQLFSQNATLDLVENLQSNRQQRLEEIEQKEIKQNAAELGNVQSWLAGSNLDQDDDLEELQLRCHDDSCDWIQDNVKVKSWIRQGIDHRVLWLKGKPGSGKSILCAKLIEHLSGISDTTLLYFFCMEAFPESMQHHSLLRGIIRQILQKRPELCAFVEKRYIDKGLKSSVKYLREVLRILLVAFKSVRIVIDGLDECVESEQKLILSELIALTSMDASARICKVLVSSQDTISISRSLQDRTIIDLSEERVVIQKSISSFVRAKIAQSPLFSDAENVNQESLKAAEDALVDKADGMFLWVQLVISMLEKVYSPHQMQQALIDLPKGLDRIYDKLLSKILEQADAPNNDLASRVIQWLSCSQRPLKKYEVQDAVSFCPNNTHVNESTRVHERVFELCKPLVEDGSSSVVRFVHASVKVYLLKHHKLFDNTTAQFHAAYSCLLYLLNFGISLIDSDQFEGALLVAIGKGFHGLCQYATRYWVEHLLAYMKLVEDTPNESTEALIQLANSVAQNLLLVSHEQSTRYGSGSINKIERPKHDVRANLLKEYEPLYSLVRSTLEASSIEMISPRLRGQYSATIKHPIQNIRQRYETLVAQVLQADSIRGLDSRTLKSFKKTYSLSILVCRFTDCPQGLRGFPTAEERDLHESTHIQIYRCPHPRCSKHQRGFPNQQLLQQHLDQFHTEPNKPQELPSIKPYGETRVVGDEMTTSNNEPPRSPSPHWRDRKGRTRFARACENNDLEKAEKLLEKQPSVLNMPDDKGNTPLHLAVMEEHIDIVWLLIEAENCEVDARNHEQDTPLILAVERGNVEIVEILVEQGHADPLLGNANGIKPLQLVPKDDELTHAEIRALLKGEFFDAWAHSTRFKKNWQ